MNKLVKLQDLKKDLDYARANLVEVIQETKGKLADKEMNKHYTYARDNYYEVEKEYKNARIELAKEDAIKGYSPLFHGIDYKILSFSN